MLRKAKSIRSHFSLLSSDIFFINRFYFDMYTTEKRVIQDEENNDDKKNHEKKSFFILEQLFRVSFLVKFCVTFFN